MSQVPQSLPRLAPDRPLLVSAHAIQRFRSRNGAGADYHALEQEIAHLVADAFAAGRFRNHKTKPFRLYRERGRELPRSERFCWDQEERVGFMVRRCASEDVVTTTLIRTASG